jgi:hypothetical protein
MHADAPVAGQSIIPNPMASCFLIAAASVSPRETEAAAMSATWRPLVYWKRFEKGITPSMTAVIDSKPIFLCRRITLFVESWQTFASAQRLNKTGRDSTLVTSQTPRRLAADAAVS